MPATEKTWRDQMRMHVIFGISSLAMLAATVLMLWKDHNREWRKWQLADRDRVRWTIEAQLAQAEADSKSQLEMLQRELDEARAAAIDTTLVDEFKEVVATHEEGADFAALDEALAAVQEAEAGTAAAADTRARLLAAMGEFVNEVSRREDQQSAARKFLAADLTAAIAERGLAVRDGKPTEEIESRVQALTDQITEQDVQLAATEDYRRTLEGIVGQITAAEDDIQKQIVQLEAELTRLQDNLRAVTTNPGEWIVRGPILDAFYTGDIKLDQIWLPDLKINYNFSYVARYDRCINCHRAIDKTLPGSAVEPAYPPIPRGHRVRQIELATPQPSDITSEALYGLTVAPSEQEGGRAIQVTAVKQGSPADQAGLMVGDVLEWVDDNPIGSADFVGSYLCDPSHWGSTLRIEIRRGEDSRVIDLETPMLETIYGFRLSPYGQVDDNAVTIQVVSRESLAAKAGLQMGDIFLSVNGGTVRSADDVRQFLMKLADWGQPLSLEIRRGLDQPFTSHPRLDLYVGSLSPHKMGKMGCTICHDGQGSATEFKWASHTPNDPNQALDWANDHGWFDNHHWIYPMTPQRFIESNCLKCHFEVVELEPSERFPDPPAPKLVRGYHLVREFGCYGCHEMNGYESPDKQIGPDLRLEPNYHEVAQQILKDPGLDEAEKEWATTLVDHPDDRAARDQLMRSILQDKELAEAARRSGGARGESTDDDSTPQPRLSAETHALADALKDVEVPGKFRKAGPSLRHIASKVDFDWLYRWIRRPADFRPTTRMPQFFGHYEHLNKERRDFTLHDADGNEVLVTDPEYTQRFENIEVRALAEFLLARSQPGFDYVEPPANVTEAPSAERGRWLFETRGCLACHSHREFRGMDEIRSDRPTKLTQGPDLSRLAAKLNTQNGRRWLYTWLKNPHQYFVRTLMPNLFLEPIVETDPASGTPTGRVTDPAADIAEFLLSVPADWDPEVPAPSRELTPQEEQDLTDLTAVWLAPSFQSKRLAQRYAREGIPERIASQVKVDEQVLVGDLANMPRDERNRRKLEYVARRSMSRYGCFACHDIPGFETAKPIGTPLSGWGRKDTSQLAFENIVQFLVTHGLDGDQQDEGEHGDQEATGHGLNPLDYDDDVGYFLQALLSHQRNGFLWQKLRMPRAYDYETTVNKRYDERLRMPKFPLDSAQREAIMTFILGLTSEAPDSQYIYNPPPAQEAIVQGRDVLYKYNCAGCHILDMERWDIAFEPGWFEEPLEVKDFPFLKPVITEEQIEQSLEPDRRGFLHAQLHGMPVRDEATGQPQLVDEDRVPLLPDDEESEPYYEFSLYQTAVVEGAARLVGLQNLLIPAMRSAYGPAHDTAYPGWGGDLAKYLYPHVIAAEKRVNPAAVAKEAWGWLPPPLFNEGVKVQTDWLHDFLMDPVAIRPAVVMRMPNFHMSSDEAAKLVDFFAAKSGAEFPYEYNSRRRSSNLAMKEAAYPGMNLLDDAMKIVTDGNYCVKCHSIGDYEVAGAVRTLGPRLDDVYRRMRPDYVHRWVADPQRILPYTGMPVNISYDPNLPNDGGVSQQLFRGTSIQQLDGVVELLMNFDEYALRQTSVRALVREATVSTEAGGGGQ